MNKKRSTVHRKRKEVSQRLLESGLRFFAVNGFEGATVRDICEDAGSNLAAINYYFKDKQGFFAEVCAYAHRLLRDRFNQLCSQDVGTDPWKRLKSHVKAMVESAYNSTLLHASWLYMREIMSPRIRELSSADHGDASHEAMEQQTWQMMCDLLGDAATRENIVLLHYTYVSLSLFMIIQQHVETMSQRHSRFGVSAQLDQERIGQYIIGVMENTIDRMKAGAAPCAAPV